MRTSSGTSFLMAEMAALEQMSTKAVAKPMLMPLMAEEVVASVGHMPRRRAKVGFSVIIPFLMTLR